MSRTLAVVIGVSRCESSAFGALPGASADAKRFSRALRTWGLASEDICVLIDEFATRAAILRALRVWPLQGADRNVRIIFFFAGHGDLVEDSANPARSVLIGYDTCPDDRAATGVLLTEVIGGIGRIQPREAYLFIDACRQRIDTLDNPLQLPDKDVVASTSPSARCFFCLLAAGASKAYETRRSARGVFTSVLLRQLAELRKGNGTVATLAARVRDELVARGVNQPEYCAPGTDD